MPERRSRGEEFAWHERYYDWIMACEHRLVYAAMATLTGRTIGALDWATRMRPGASDALGRTAHTWGVYSMQNALTSVDRGGEYLL